MPQGRPSGDELVALIQHAQRAQDVSGVMGESGALRERQASASHVGGGEVVLAEGRRACHLAPGLHQPI
jgi:hypothetical protein